MSKNHSTAHKSEMQEANKTEKNFKGCADSNSGCLKAICLRSSVASFVKLDQERRLSHMALARIK